jgi:hypothetical protein
MKSEDYKFKKMFRKTTLTDILKLGPQKKNFCVNGEANVRANPNFVLKQKRTFKQLWMAILAKDLSKIKNKNIKKYYKNINSDRKEIENTSTRFNLKYILAIINSNLISHFIKFNNKGNIDFYPDDWKKIPIKDISLKDQQPFIELAEKVIYLKQQGKDTIEFENIIDKLVYKLYNVTPNEQETIQLQIRNS